MTLQPADDHATTPHPRSDAGGRLRAVTESQARLARARAIAARRRAARTAHSAHRTWIALLFFPTFAVYLVLDAARDLRDYLARARPRPSATASAKAANRTVNQSHSAMPA